MIVVREERECSHVVEPALSHSWNRNIRSNGYIRTVPLLLVPVGSKDSYPKAEFLSARHKQLYGHGYEASSSIGRLHTI